MLENATIADRTAMAELMATVSAMTSELATTNTKLTKVLADLTAAELKLALKEKSPKAHESKFIHYCWTHGPDYSHLSLLFRKKSDGHKDEAINRNRMCGRDIKWVTRYKSK